MRSHAIYPKLTDVLWQKYFLLLLILPFFFLIEIEGVACGETLDSILMNICLNGYNTKDLGGPIRYRRQSDNHMPKYLFSKQFFVQPNETKQKLFKQKPSLKQILKMKARWQQKHQISSKRVRRDDNLDPADIIKKGIVDYCCLRGCPYSTIERYCRELDDRSSAG